MSNTSQRIIDTVSSWDGIKPQPHRFGGTEFMFGGVEIGHVHDWGLVDIPFTRRTREALVADGEADLHHILPESGWISFWLRGDQDVAQAIRLFRLSYAIKRARRRHVPLDLDGLHFSAAVMNSIAQDAASADAPEGE